MWSDTAEGHQLIREITRNVVLQVAPEELEVFELLLTEYFQDPRAPQVSTAAADDPLGFGLSEALVAVTPAAATVVSTVLSHLITETIKATKGDSETAVKARLKTLRRGTRRAGEPAASESKEVAPLTREQMEQVRNMARKQALAIGISAGLAETMANALVGSLTLGA
jgi:hypothetical protein